MKGSSHAYIGAAVGAIAGFQIDATDPLTITTSAIIGSISALVPDLDTNGTASNRITLSKSFSQWLMRLVGMGLLIAIIFQFFQTGITPNIIIFAGIGALLLVIFRFIKQRRMLTLTGILVMAIGFVMHQSIGILLAGSYIIIASFLAHRSYTHSLIGLAFYAFILHHIHLQWPIDGLFIAGTAGYASHLIADLKLLPVNRRGVKLFAPIWNKEW
ncbi:metal-dependent hydrolase [Sporosarcina sp. Sa2YVA2]|uniref:Metal-dependent hydrolase n=1 Tax=Sporosarcina quadrami TaxID=2762234 RepID=A0ABR8U9Z1_9BACL|nr:metal-dependent hydrolase [Sporosarcina quadrami]MBD7984857.1 metal-dependent hydrolase [Sporosarcina quadrami]